MKQLLLCGYDSENKNDNKFLNENTILFKIPYDFNIIHNKEQLNNVKISFEDKGFDLKIKFFNSIQNNIGYLLIHQFRFPKIKVLRVIFVKNYIAKHFISCDEYIELKNGFF